MKAYRFASSQGLEALTLTEEAEQRPQRGEVWCAFARWR
jgi:hypothetical protein